MSENQTIEYKQSWRDEYLSCICGFANTQGGTLYIGIADDGSAVGVPNAKRLMEDIPSKIGETMGIVADVTLDEKNGKEIIVIVVHPYSNPISLKGKFYIRVGSTTRELTGNSLIDFLLRRSGKTWDDVVEPRSTFDDIDEQSVKEYIREASTAGRLPDLSNISIAELFEKLRLTEDGKLKRAAIILFGKDPGRFYPSTAIKIGRYEKDDADLKFQEVIEGCLVKVLGAIPDQLNYKFLTRPISFEGLHRNEGEYPAKAMRELLLNALVHRDYMGSHTQIRVYDNKFSCWNDGSLPEGLSLESLKRQHPSRPRNPLIADVCFKGGYIDTWGRGTLTIVNECKNIKLPEPELKEQDGGFIVTLFNGVITKEELENKGLNERQIKAVFYVKEKGRITNKIYQEICQCSNTTAGRELADLVHKNWFVLNDVEKGVKAFYSLKG